MVLERPVAEILKEKFKAVLIVLSYQIKRDNTKSGN